MGWTDDAPRLAVAPGLAIALTVLGAQCLAVGLRSGGPGDGRAAL